MLNFKNWTIKEILKVVLNQNDKKSRSLYKLSFIKWKISKNSILQIVSSIHNLSQLDLSENDYSKDEAQEICDELSYLDFIYMFNNKSDISQVSSSNLILN